jgi:uncharacterized membrane protein YeaQ/YmgE (transglycosylase-associated protein family)
MSILGWIVVGIVAGFLAKHFVPGEGPGGLLGDLVVGLAGALIGGWLFSFFGHEGYGYVFSTIVAFVGAVLLLLILRALGGRRAA